ncbi:MAG: hypothetical protein ACPL0B_02760, partial [Anaerolineales bacterium]
MTVVILILVVFIIIGAVILTVIGIREANREDPLQKRLAEYADQGNVKSLEEIELSQPFTERVIFPLARKFGELATKFTPQSALQNTAHRLELAGSPRGIDPTIFWAARFLVALLAGGIVLFLFT